MSQDLQRFFAISPELMGLACPLSARWKSVNPAFTRTLGFTEAELLEMPALDLIHPQDVQFCRAAESDLFQGRTVEISNRIRTKSENWIWISWTIIPDAERKVFYCFGRDITTQKLAISEGQRSAKQVAELTAIFDRAPIGLALLDHELKFQRINRYLADINGLAVVDHIGRSAWDIVPDLKRAAEPALRKVIDQALPVTDIEIQGKTIGAPSEIRTWREHFFPIDLEGERGVGIVCEDITAEQRAQTALAKNEQRLRIALEGARAGVWEWDFATGATFWSPEMYELLGVDTAVPPSFEAFSAAIHELDRERTLARFFAAATGGASKFELEFRTVEAGPPKWLSAVGSIEYGHDGKPVRACGINQNVTVRKTAELNLATSEVQLRRALQAGKVFAFQWDRASDASVRSESADLILATPSSKRIVSTGREFLKRVHPDDRRLVLYTTTKDRTPDKPNYEISYRFRRDVGQEVWLEETGAASFDAKGRTTGVHGICRDITAGKRDEARSQLLMNEISHRAKNMLAVVQAVVHFTKADTVEEFASAIRQRMQALARVQGLLSTSEWCGTGLAKLVANELEPFGGVDGKRLVASGPPVLIRPEAMQTLTLVLHELATNAAKYGALSIGTGKVVVGWEITPEANLHISWQESGGPAVSGPSRRGFGSRLIEESLGQLGGRARLSYAPAGLHCDLTIGKDSLG